MHDQRPIEAGRNGRAMLQVSCLRAGYTAMPILQGVSLSCASGSITTIVGPNGCGKSTLLKAIIGLVGVSAGEVTLEGERITGLPPAELLRRGLTLVPQVRSVFPQMTVEENLRIGGYSLLDRRDLGDRIERAYSLFPRLRERRRQIAGTLSGGEQRLLEIGRALMLKPKMLLLDEPSAMLAPGILDELFGEIRRIRERGTTILLVEQNIRKAFEITDFVYVFDFGTNHISGRPEECSNNPALASLFLG